ncbi:hypothetical protein VIGAN_02215800 [Vigna angularis var. angularis]|uniref:Uncharacterized protein n=1 Tax=Vigna angularis var. angularis TaxID=157739 RepID=A0A0S3RF72_PHAAN|nr:hypothetical protein VIGAN_02215800 [Vigna angularis var. angularis]
MNARATRPREVVQRGRRGEGGSVGAVRRGRCSDGVDESNRGTNMRKMNERSTNAGCTLDHSERKASPRRRMLHMGRRTAEVAPGTSKTTRKKNTFVS